MLYEDYDSIGDMFTSRLYNFILADPEYRSMLEGWADEIDAKGLDEYDAVSKFTYRLDNAIWPEYNAIRKEASARHPLAASLLVHIGDMEIDYDWIARQFLDSSRFGKGPVSCSRKARSPAGRKTSPKGSKTRHQSVTSESVRRKPASKSRARR